MGTPSNFDLFKRPCPACVDSAWAPTGEAKCVGDTRLIEEKSNCGTTRWVDDGDVTWTPTGEFKCTGNTRSVEEINECGTTRWVDDGDVTWTATGLFECRGDLRFNEETNECGTKRMVPGGAVTWTPTGATQCVDGVVSAQETNECGASRWTPTATECGFCPSYALPVDRCDGGTGFAFRESDPKDPAATVELAECDGDFKVFVFPTAARGHTIPVTDCDGNIIGYAANASDCAGQIVQTVAIEGALEIAKLPGLQVDKLPEIKVAKHVVTAVQVGNQLWTIWSDGTKTVEELPPPPVVYCPSIRLYCDGKAGFGYHAADPKDPAATVELTACGSPDPVYIYPTAGQGHTLRITDGSGNFIGYAANQSACAAEFHPDTVINVNVEPADVSVTLPSPSLVSAHFDQGGLLTLTSSDGTPVQAQIPTCE